MSGSGTAGPEPSGLRAQWPGWLDDALRGRLEAAYADPGRGYHDLRHLAEVLAHVAELLAPGDPAREAVQLAAWFHDAVYDGEPGAEERSARLAEAALTDAGAPPGLAAEVGRLVRLTEHHRPAADDRAGQVLCDADLAILAADPDRYASYVAGVRAEYASVPDADFAAGRAAVLEALLDAPRLFATESGRQRWETRARANAEREVGELTGSGRGGRRADPPTGRSAG